MLARAARKRVVVSHIHIPDGVLPPWLWVTGWVVALALVTVASRASERADVRRKVPLLGAISALMLVAMSSEVVPIAYHINLTVVAGVLLGPVLSVVAAFVVEILLAMLGHGGVTVLGLNTLIVIAEMVFGWALFRTGVALLGRARTHVAAGGATVLTLALTTTMLVGVVALAGSASATQRETGALDPSSLTFANPFSEGVYSVNLLRGEGESEGESARAEETALSVGRFAAVVYTLGPLGWVIEALITAGVLGYVARVRPTLVFHGAMAETGRVILGDQHGGH